MRYHPALVALHWAIALLILATAYLALFGGGEGRREAARGIAGFPPLSLHMLLGLVVLVLLVVRIVVRWRTRRPAWAGTGSVLLDRIGVLTHWGLYIFAFAITITGLILALQTNRLSRAFSPLAPAAQRAPLAPTQPAAGQFPPSRQFTSGQFSPGGSEGRFERGGGFFLGAFHGLSWTLLLLLIFLHLGASLYHQFLRRDGLMGRMWFGSRVA